MRCLQTLHRAVLIPLCALLAGSAAADDPAPPPMILEPEQEEIIAAYRGWIDDLNARAVDLLGRGDAASVRLVLEDLRKLSCRRLEREPIQYDCRVEARLRVADRLPKTRVMNLWVRRDSEGWVVR
jgi:hypothetical protein